MFVIEHDPSRFVVDLSAKLAASSRHVCLLLGAGTAKACGLPDMTELEKRVQDKLAEPNKQIFKSQLTGRGLEGALTRIRRIAALLDDEQLIDDMTGDVAAELDLEVCRLIIKELNLDSADLVPARGLAAWVDRAEYRSPVEIFTLNYDLLLETALETQGASYFDGFVGNIRAAFRTDLVEAEAANDTLPPKFARLWKLHGSVNWAWQDDGQVVRLGNPLEEGPSAAIYPSDAKYDESRRVPFVVLQDRFRRALNQPETLLLVSGYSFSDDHINELIFTAAARRQRSEVIVFCYSDIPSVLAEQAAITPNLQAVGTKSAILGGISATWKEPPEPCSESVWNSGGFALSDFRSLGAFFARSSASDSLESQDFLSELAGVTPSETTSTDAERSG